MALRVPLLLSEEGIQAVALFTCPSRRISRSFHFLVDTGSKLSFLAWQDAANVGIDLEALPNYRKGLAGIGGAAEARHLTEPCFNHLKTDQGGVVTVELPDGVLIWRPSRKKSARSLPSLAIGILGREFMERLGWTLLVNMAQKEFYFER